MAARPGGGACYVPLRAPAERGAVSSMPGSRTMRNADTRYRLLLSAAATTVFLLLAGPRTVQAQDTRGGVASSAVPACANDAGLRLPTGFCASIFADNLGHVRHMVAAPDGVLYAN